MTCIVIARHLLSLLKIFIFFLNDISFGDKQKEIETEWSPGSCNLHNFSKLINAIKLYSRKQRRVLSSWSGVFVSVLYTMCSKRVQNVSAFFFFCLFGKQFMGGFMKSSLLMRNSLLSTPNLTRKGRSLWEEGLAVAADSDQMSVFWLLWSFGKY